MKGAKGEWAGFWNGEPAAMAGATLANLPPALQEVLDAPWLELASRLPNKAQVLDLATGGGIVLELLRRGRCDLGLTGIDHAPNLPDREGMALRGGVSTDRLPFADASFDAVTSRFGLEYGPLSAGGAEAARVLRPGGQVCMIAHHAASNVLRHNRARRDALYWAAHESGWVDKAINFSKTRSVMALPTPQAFRSAPADGAARFPGQSVAWEFLTGLCQVLDGVPAPHGEAAVRDLVVRADGELARLDALALAACDAARLEDLTQALANGGVRLDPPRTLDEPGGAPLAWLVKGRRPS